MALFKQNKTISDLPGPMKTDFEMSKPDFDDDFPKYTPTIGNFESTKDQKKSPMPFMPKKIMIGENMQNKKANRPIFIKIDKYEEAIDHISSVKDKVKEIEQIVDSLRKIKKEEDQALDEWKENLNQIKEKLLIVDKNLFQD